MSTINKIEVSGVTYDIEDTTARSQSGLTDEAKQALLACFQNVAWISASGQTYYDALETALYPPANLVSISAVYTQSGTVYDSDSLDSLKSDLVVTAHYSNSTTATVTNYILSGTLTVGTSTITVAYGGKTTTFTVTVTSSDVVIDFTDRTYTDAHALNNQGSWVAYTGWQTYDDPISVEGFTKVSYSLLASYSYNNLYINGISFFDSSDAYLCAIDVAHCDTAELIKTAPASGYKLSGISNIPSQASYMKVTRWEDSNAGMVLEPSVTLQI